MSESWKILMYVAADNNLYEEALVSLSQIVHASRLSNIDILVQFDGPISSLASRFRCANGSKTLLWQASAGYTTDRGKRLADFLDWTLDHSRRDARTFLGLWGHGAGIDHAYAYKISNSATQAPSPEPAVRQGIQFPVKDLLNSTNANVYVTNIQLGCKLKEFAKKAKRKIDILGFDACSMGMVEIAHEVRHSVSLLVASDEEIPTASWPYKSIVSDLAKYPGMDPCTFSSVIVSRYVERYATAEAAHDNPYGVSLSCYSLSECERFAQAFKKLVAAIKASLYEGTTMARVVRARDFARVPIETSYIDVAAFLKELTESFNDKSRGSQAILSAAQETLNVLLSSSLIVYHRDLAEDGAIKYRGLALYFPDSLAPEEVNGTQPPIDSLSDQAKTLGSKSFQQSRQPLQPVFLAPAPTPRSNMAIPSTKTPPRGPKTMAAPDGTSRIITSYRVIWSHYDELEFNKQTHWSDLVKEFLPQHPTYR